MLMLLSILNDHVDVYVRADVHVYVNFLYLFCDHVVDARVAMALAKLKILSGKDFGVETQPSIFDEMEKVGRKSAGTFRFHKYISYISSIYIYIYILCVCYIDIYMYIYIYI